MAVPLNLPNSRPELGYIVCNRSGPLMLCTYDDRTRVLVNGGSATVFPTRKAAEVAIRRTNRYSERHKLGWPRNRKIVRLIADHKTKDLT